MACLVPQFKCPAASSDAHLRSPHHLNTRVFVHFQSQCSSSQITAVIEKIRIPTLDAHSNLSTTAKPSTYVGVIGPPEKDLLKLERIQEELAERIGKQTTFVQWAAAAELDTRTLRQRLNYGTHCKEKMIKSNIRVVISIAKNFQGAGISIQDLVQEGCPGLLRGAEKFDA